MKELLITELGNRKTYRSNTTRGGEIMKIELNRIQVRDGFNVRKDYGDIQSLANSIAENGQALPGRVDVLADGTFLLTDGHRRYNACLLLAERGEAPLFKAIVNEQKTTEEQRILQMFTTQDNKPLLPHEIAELIQRLVNLGYNQVSVAKKIGKTPAYVSHMLSFCSDAHAIKEEVVAGNLTVSASVELQKRIPSVIARVAAVKSAVSKANGKSISVADVTGTNPKEKKAAKLAMAISQEFGIDEAELQEFIISLL